MQFVGNPSDDVSNQELRVSRHFSGKKKMGGWGWGEYQLEEKTEDAVRLTSQFVLCDAGTPVAGKYATYVQCSDCTA